MTQPFNKLSSSDVELLSMLAEEAAEVVQEANKLLLKSYDTWSVYGPRIASMSDLSREISDFVAISTHMWGHVSLVEDDGKTPTYQKQSANSETDKLMLLTILSQRMGAAIQAIMKILRHGYNSYNPFDEDKVSNRVLLHNELTGIYACVISLEIKYDITGVMDRKMKYTHHQTDGEGT
jgi:hypothetical protein